MRRRAKDPLYIPHASGDHVLGKALFWQREGWACAKLVGPSLDRGRHKEAIVFQKAAQTAYSLAGALTRVECED